MKRNVVKLTESEFNRLVESSVRRVINENDWAGYVSSTNSFVYQNQQLIQQIAMAAQKCLKNEGGDGELFWLCGDYCQRYQSFK